MIRLAIHTLWIVALVFITLRISGPIRRLGDGMVWQAQEMKAAREAIRDTTTK